MGKMRPFSHDPDSGITVTYEDLGDDGFALHTAQDAQWTIEENKRKANAGREYYAKDPDMWRVASIPIGIQMEWLVKDGIDIYNPDHRERVKKKLNDPEWKYLKTANIII